MSDITVRFAFHLSSHYVIEERKLGFMLGEDMMEYEKLGACLASATWPLTLHLKTWHESDGHRSWGAPMVPYV